MAVAPQAPAQCAESLSAARSVSMSLAVVNRTV